jgi:hypothetical protein
VIAELLLFIKRYRSYWKIPVSLSQQILGLLNCAEIKERPIMTIITFDTLELVDNLKTAGIPQA